jgi:hypothetical protein
MTGTRCALLLLLASIGACSRPAAPPERIVHEERALAKANAAWTSIYSKTAEDTYSAKNIRRFAPYSATLDGGAWRVRTNAPSNVHGRAPEADIRAEDGVTTVRGVER